MRGSTLKHVMAAGLLVALTGLTACSGGVSNDTMSSGSAGGAAAPERAPAGSGKSGDSTGSTGADRTVLSTTAVIRTGEVAVTAPDLGRLRSEVDDLLAALGGSIADEKTVNDRHGRVERSTLVLRVPVGRFAAAKKALEGLGRLKTSDESSKDVTTEVIDVNERVQTLQNSLDRLQRFQRTAQDVGDLLRYEDQITARQSELQSLKAQQSYLSDQTSMATITLYLSTPEKYVPPPDGLAHAGFLSGLSTGWHALGDCVLVALTVLGAALPFLATGLLVGVPTWIGLRALLRRRRTPPLPPAPQQS